MDDELQLQEPETVSDHEIPVRRSTSGQGWIKVLLGTGLGALLTVGVQSLGLSPETVDAPAAADRGIPRVTVTTLTATRVQRTLEATGTVAATEMLSVLSPTSGLQIRQVLVEEGDLVEAGQVLAVLDSAVLQSQGREAAAQLRVTEARLSELQAGNRVEAVDRAQLQIKSAEAAVEAAIADLELAKERVRRNRSLAAEGVIASDRLDDILNQERSRQSDLKQAQAELQQAQQQFAELNAGARPEAIAQAQAERDAAYERVQTLRAQLTDTQVLAPSSGKIAERHARVGDVTSPSSPLFSIIDNQQLELHLQVPETQLAQIRPQQQVWVSSDNQSDHQSELRLSGQVESIDPLVDPQSRMATVNVRLPNTDRLKPGMFLRGAIVTANQSGLVLPTQAVLPQPDGRSVVYRLEADQRVTAQTIVIGELLPQEKVEIRQGIKSGDRIVVLGAAYLGDGDRVEVVK
jgi:HlyD family secretion protein